MFRITYTQGNGYRCGCCRREWTETVDCETEQEVIEWLSELKACQTESKWEDDDDREVEEIREIKDEELDLKPDPERVQQIIAERRAEKERKKQEEEEKALERKRKQLDELKKELGE